MLAFMNHALDESRQPGVAIGSQPEQGDGQTCIFHLHVEIHSYQVTTPPRPLIKKKIKKKETLSHCHFFFSLPLSAACAKTLGVIECKCNINL